MSRAAALDRLTVYAATLRESDPEASALLMALIAREQQPKPRVGRVKTQRVYASKNGAPLDVSEELIKRANERTK